MASSIKNRRYFSARETAFSILARLPNTCTTIIALTCRPVLRFTRPPSVISHSVSQKRSTLSISMQSVSSQSMNTGSAPTYFTGLTAAIKVSVGTRTSSFACTFPASSAKCSPAVPFWQATAPGVPTYAAIFSSNSSIYAPPVDTHSLSIARLTYFASFPLRFGTDNGINLLIVRAKRGCRFALPTFHNVCQPCGAYRQFVYTL